MEIYKKLKKEKEKGMTYIELIVVLSIFSVMAAIVMFNYGGFQAKVDIKNLSNDIALKVVEAQKASLAGKIPPAAQFNQTASTWKPSYGVYFNKTTDNKSFIYYTDIDGSGSFSDSDMSCAVNKECLQKISITKGNYISNVFVYYQDGNSAPINNVALTFKRPDSSAIIQSTSITPPLASPIDYIEVDVLSPKGASAKVKIYQSGRVQIN